MSSRRRRRVRIPHLAFSHELGALLESAIERLPDGTREVFVLRQIEG